MQTFNRTGGRGYWASEPGQLVAAGVNRDLGCDTLWLDAGWFEGDFSEGVGNWFPKTKDFPRGLRPVGDACQRLGLKFLVWYEPEDVKPGTKIAREHPEFILPVQKTPGEGGLFNLGDPQARRWITDLLIRQIAEFNIHTYRNDFNMAPLPFWRQNNAPTGRVSAKSATSRGSMPCGMKCARSIRTCIWTTAPRAGGASTWRCSSRGVVQTQSDFVGPGRLEAAQCQNYGLNLFLPLHATISWDMDAYACRSTATAGFCGEWDILGRSFPFDEGRAAIAEIVANRKYWYGDFYPLTPCATTGDAWIAWQLHRADLDEGLVLAFRRKDSRKPTLSVRLRGLKPEKTYAVTFLDQQRRTTVVAKTGRELSSLVIELPVPRSSVAIRYAPGSNGKRARMGRPPALPFPLALLFLLPFSQRHQPPPGWGSRCWFSANLTSIPPIAGIKRRFFRFHPQILCLFGRLNYREIPKNRNLRTLPHQARTQDT